MEVSGQLYGLAALLPRSNPATHWLRGWMVATVCLDGFGEDKNLLLLLEFEPRTTQPIADRYTDWAIPARRLASYG